LTTPGNNHLSAGQHAPYRSRLHESLATRPFTVTAEVVPPRGATLSGVQRMARQLKDWIIAANITDGQSAMTRMASWAGCIGLMQAGLEPVMQLQCRDRNRIALQADMLGAGAVGIPNMLFLTGDHQRYGDHPDARGVFDLDSTQLIWVASTLRDKHHTLSERKLSVSPRWFIGAVENPFAAPQQYRAERVGKKIAAGAQFVQTQLVFDLDVFRRWIQQVRDLGLDRRCYFIAGVGAITSLGALEFMRHLPGIVIPESVEKRLRGVPEDRFAEEALREMPGVSGVHISASRWENLVPEVLTRAGIGRHGLEPGQDKAAGAAVQVTN
jgi:methylenetetrahydrofolate reductase (NADPH)